MDRIGIIGAMDEEIVMMKKEMQIEETKKTANMEFYIGTLEGQEIVLVKCGIGKVNAAVCTQILISEMAVNTVINPGVAGAIYNELDVYDVVISTDVQQHDVDVRVFGYKVGEIPRMERSVFKAEEALVKKAYFASTEVLKGHRAFTGRIVSGDVFVSSIEMKEKLWNYFSAYCTEMEGAAIGHTCYLNNVPFVIIRAISDKADGSAPSNFNEFVHGAAAHSKEIVKNILRHL